MNTFKRNHAVNKLTEGKANLPTIDPRPCHQINSNIPVEFRKPLRDYANTNSFRKPKSQQKRKPGILDRIALCESEEAAHLMFHEFLDHANEVSQKTINRATKLLSTLDFPLP